MGAENSALGSCVLKEPPFTLPSGLAVYPAVLQDGKLASVFVYKRENEDKVHKAAQHLKTLRHPCLLRFLSCTVEADGIHLVTERVQPLAVALETLSSAEVCAGIYDILLALIFLHDRGHLTHNNVCLSSVFVSEDGHWKLGGMETVCRVSQATPEFLRSIRSVRDPAGIPPEEKSPEFTALPESHGHARDAYAFGTLVERVLSVLSGQVSADALSSFQQNLHSALLNPSPKCRPALSTLLSHDFFRNDFLEIVNFLKSLTLKSEEEKTEFFKKPGNSSARVLFATTCPRKFLLDRVSCLSEELVASRLVPLLLNQLVFAEPVAVKSFLPHLLGPKKAGVRGACPGLLSPALFQASVVPVLLQLFQVHEEHVRMVLLSHLEAYVGHFTQGQLRTVILPQVLLGLRDTSNSIVAITLHSLAVLVSLLGPEVVVGGQRTKIFKRTAPSFAKAADLAPEGDRLPQPVKRPVNGIADGNGPSGHGADLPSSSRPPEEWPDWSEPEETDDRTGSAKAWPPEPRPAAGSPRADLTVVEVWSDPETNPGTGTTAGEHAATPTAHPLPEGSAALTSGQQQTTSPAPGVGDPGQPPEAPSRERRLKTPTEVGLGEEFTIQVKRRPAPDPELDWFADMIPEITPPAALLVLPDLRTETGAPNKERASPVTPFSSKFAAADITEAESEGWGDEGELNWEDNSW